MVTAKLVRHFCSVCLLHGLLCAPLPGSDRWLPAPPQTMTPEEQSLLQDAADGHLDVFPLLDAALLAENDTPDVEARDRFEKLARKLQALPDLPSAESHDFQRLEQRLATTLRLLHQQILVGQYRPDATSVTLALQKGHYNCVSSTILFVELCRRQGIRTTPMASATHVFCRVEGPGRPIDVQTTSPRWFDLSDEQRAAATPDGAHSALPITDAALVGKLYYNFGVQHLEHDRYQQAERAFRMSLLLDPQDASARENLLATWNNWALALAQQGHYAEAMKRLDQARQVAPNYPPLRANLVHVTQQWAQSLCRLGRHPEALTLLESRKDSDPQAPLFIDGPPIVYRLWIEWLEQHGRPAEAEQVLNEALRRYPHSTLFRSDALRISTPSSR